MQELRFHIFLLASIFVISSAHAGVSANDAKNLPKIQAAPELQGISGWLNSPPLTLKALRGKVVLLDFWTYSCINCIRTFPHISRWYKQYKDRGFVVIGVHSPEFEFEKDANNVKKGLERFGIQYPVALDNNFKTWAAYDNHYWPAHYLIDQAGIVRQVHFGEGAYLETENAIRALLNLPAITSSSEGTGFFRRALTPETYLGFARAGGYASGVKIQKGKEASYAGPKNPSSDEVSLRGTWFVGPESVTAKSKGATLYLNFYATHVYLVMSGRGNGPVTVMLDGKPLPKEFRTGDMNDKGEIWVNEARKYDVVQLKGQSGRHTLELKFPEEVSAYAFTFGDD